MSSGILIMGNGIIKNNLTGNDSWRDVRGFEGYYLVSDRGKIINLITQNIVSPTFDGRYFRIELKKDDSIISIAHHRIIAEAFIPNPNNKPQVNHINGIKHDNRIDNLEWVTASENVRHAHEIGLAKKNVGAKHYKSKRVAKCDLNGVVICVYDTHTSAAKENRLNQSNITAVTLGKRNQCGGYLWTSIE